MRECRVCAGRTNQIMSFGRMPIANGFLKSITMDEFFFNLSADFCPRCFTVQLGETVKPELLFNDSYQFISSTSNAMAVHFEEIAGDIVKNISGKNDPFIVELGCNDGIMLRHIASRGLRHLGVEPSGNVAALARKNGVRVIEKFFNKDSAAEIVRADKEADVICGANVFCHIEDINSVFEGVNVLLKKEGILFFEEPYLLDIVEKSSFDQIYDEHVYYFSGLSISELAKRHGMQLVDMAPQDVHGGSMRYYIKKGASNPVSGRVAEFLRREREKNLDTINGYAGFKTNVDKICLDLRKTLEGIKKDGHKIIGYGATSKSTTLLNYAGIGHELLDYICDITPNKINKFTPGMHILIKSYDAFTREKPGYTLLLAWNHKREIFEKEKEYRRRGGKFITFFPEVVVE